MKADLLGITIDFMPYEDLIIKIFQKGYKTITYANQYVLNEAFTNEKLRSDLSKFDLIHSDGIGVQKAFKYLYDKNTSRVTGSDMYYKLFDILNQKSLSIFIFGSTQNVLESSIKFINERFPQIIIKGSKNGFSNLSDPEIVKEINLSNSDFLFVGLGTPKQESWIVENKDILQVDKIISIGGGLRVITGDRKRGPVFIQKLGLEWMVRLVEEPVKNFQRYIVGIPLFLYRIIKQKSNNELKLINS